MALHVTPMHFWLNSVIPLLTVSQKLISHSGFNNAATIVWRIFLHSIIILPTFQLTALFGIGALKNGGSVDAGMKLMCERFWDGCSLALLYWPPIYLILYTFIPMRYGNLFCDFFCLGWYSLVSFVANRDADGPLLSWSRIYGSTT